jgi:plastocyanin
MQLRMIIIDGGIHGMLFDEKFIQKFNMKAATMISKLIVLTLCFLSLPCAAYAEDVALAIKDHQFVPDTITVPANTKVTLRIKNLDNSAEEFESKELRIEKIIPAQGEGKVVLRPLKAGTYNFVGEFHEKTAKGTLVVQ